MPERTLTYPAWTSPGAATFSGIVQFSGEEEGSQVIGLPTIRVPYSVKQTETRTLTSGNNTIVIPTNSIGVVIVMPEGNSVSVTLKGIAGDTGLPLNPNGLAVLTLPNSGAPATLVLAAGGTLSGLRLIWF